MHPLLNSPLSLAQKPLLLAELVRCPVQSGRWLEFLVQQLIALIS